MNTFKAPLQPSSVYQCSPFELLSGLRLGEALGRGAFAYVLRGRWPVAPVAIKVMVTDTLDRTVLRELLVGPHMNHPNVVHTYFTRCAHLTEEYMAHLEASCPAAADSVSGTSADGGEGGQLQAAAGAEADDPSGPFCRLLHKMRARAGQFVTLVVMELCDKMTLGAANSRGLFQANQGWGEGVAKRALLRTAQEVVHGMMHLHGAGVVHGDLKPGNVLLMSSGNDRRGFEAKVADFGLAHRLGDGARYDTTAYSFGTVAYMAPECFRGRVGFAGDVYAFGVMLWELLHREIPHAGLAEGAVMRGMLAGSLELQWRPCPLVPGLVELGGRCLERDPEARPTFKQVEDELVRMESFLRRRAMEARLLTLQAEELAQALAPPTPRPAVPRRAASSFEQLPAAVVADAAVATAQPPAEA